MFAKTKPSHSERFNRTTNGFNIATCNVETRYENGELAGLAVVTLCLLRTLQALIADCMLVVILLDPGNLMLHKRYSSDLKAQTTYRPTIQRSGAPGEMAERSKAPA